MGTSNQADSAASTAKGRASILDGLVFSFLESMDGNLGIGATDPTEGATLGEHAGTAMRFDVRIRTTDLGRFFRDPLHAAEMTGTVSFPPLGGTFPIRNGRFQLFSPDPQTGMRQMIYTFEFTASDGRTYFLNGHKDIHDDPGIDVAEDMTLLYTRVHAGEDKNAPVYAAGKLFFRMQHLPSLIASIQLENARSWKQHVAARAAFLSFLWGAVREEYLKGVRPFYDTRYDNLVVSGKLREKASGGEVPFFFVSGVHDQGFPWGDGELFWDVLLAIGDGSGGWQRYSITDRVLEGLRLDITNGAYHYGGALFSPREGYKASFSEMKRKDAALSPLEADIDVQFETKAFDAVPFPFPLVKPLLRKLSSKLDKSLVEALPGERPLGIHITPHSVVVRSGSIRLRGPAGTREWDVVAAGTAGECERGTFRNLKEPTLLYSYLCALRPEEASSRVQVLSRTLRNERQEWLKDRLDAVAGAVVSRMSSAEMLVRSGVLTVKPLPPAGKPEERAVPLRKLGEPVLEVNNDHFPTGVFQRRIVEVEDGEGARCLALEEDMSLMRLEPINSTRTVTVASVRHEDQFQALDSVLASTGFAELLERKLASSGKSRQAFSIVIKPNFMFSYDKRDRSSYTDPALVGRLVRGLRARGFENIKVVEAQNTYGQYFDKRSVREMAEYLGFDPSAGYEIVDMTLDADQQRQFGPALGLHPVSRSWREADFRISFAKNKTHSYSYFSLTLKNIYGALPLANKFKEYHCNRDIYRTTIEYLMAYPVDYGLVDAWLSADGPFGVFADVKPNETRTIIGGADLVAVDWVAASKMGIDPMIGRHVRYAVEAMGKPAIRLVGDANTYRPWLNVPVALTLLTHKGQDASYHFGNLIYMVSSQMDETHFHHKNNSWYIRLLRRLTVPVRQTFFLRTGENPTLLNRFFAWLFYRLGY